MDTADVQSRGYPLDTRYALSSQLPGNWQLLRGQARILHQIHRRAGGSLQTRLHQAFRLFELALPLFGADRAGSMILLHLPGPPHAPIMAYG